MRITRWEEAGRNRAEMGLREVCRLLYLLSIHLVPRIILPNSILPQRPLWRRSNDEFSFHESPQLSENYRYCHSRDLVYSAPELGGRPQDRQGRSAALHRPRSDEERF